MSAPENGNLTIPVSRIVELDVSEPGRHFVAYLQNGRLVKISEIVERIISLLGQKKSLDEIAVRLKESGIETDSDDLEKFIKNEIVPLGLVEITGEPVKKPRRASYLWLHLPLLRGSRLKLLAGRLTFLFRGKWPLLLIVATALVSVIAMLKGDLFSIRTSGFLNANSAVILTILFASFALHELGHVVSCYHYGLSPGNLGFGFYMFRPVLFTDLSESWQLNRRQRSITSLAGIYFQALLLLPLSIWLVFDSSNAICRLAFILVASATLSNLNPFLRFDGYWLVTDLMGIPNIHFRVRQFCKQGLLRIMGRKGSKVSMPKLASPVRQFFYIYASAYVVVILLFIGAALYFGSRLVTGSYSVGSIFEPVMKILESGSYSEFAQRLNQGGLVISLMFILLYMAVSFMLAVIKGVLRSGLRRDEAS